MNLKLVILSLIFSVMLTGCQTTQNNSKIIAGAFNASTQIQKQFIQINAPKNVLSTENIVYLDNPRLHFDLYQPENIAELGKRPVVVWIHGGGWISGSKEHARGYYKRLAEQGFNVIAIEYQFAPEHIYPTQLLQIDQALAFISKIAEKYHLDQQNIFLAGDSAGANLASHYAALLSNQAYAKQSNIQPSIQLSQIKGLILHCGIYDLASFVNTASDEIKILEWGINSLVQAYTGDQKQDTAFLKSISPSNHLTPSYPPVFISGGNKDFLTNAQTMPFIENLRSQNVQVTEALYTDSQEWLVHEYQFMMSKAASQETFEKTVHFIKQYSQ